MPLSKQDVLDTLADPVLARMDFWVAGLHVSGRQFGWVRTLIEDDDIVVVEGTVNNAYYNSANNTLTTQGINPPADLDARALLLHECTHALIDMEKLSISRVSNEVACYIVQHTYILLSNPRWTVAPNNAPWFNFYTDIAKFVRDHKLDTPAGLGVSLSEIQLALLRPKLNNLNIYQHLSLHDMSLSNGVPLKPRSLTPPEPIYVRYQITANETMPEASDDYILDLLKRRYAASDVAGYGGRLRELELVFREFKSPRAKALHARLEKRVPGDAISTFFHDNLSSSARVRLLGILKSRF
jgi:hypothetical protein